MAWPFGIGAIGEHAQHALVTDSRDRREVGRASVDGRLIEFEVAGVKNRTERRAQRQRASARQAVIDVDELGFDLAVAHAIARLHRDERAGVELMVAHLGANERERERRSDDGNGKLAQQIRDAADVILVDRA